MIATLRRFIHIFLKSSGGARSANGQLVQRNMGAKAAAARGPLGAPFEDLDRPFDRAELAVGEPFEPGEQGRSGRRMAVELLAALVGEAEREAAAVVGILHALDQAGADQAVDRAADRRRAAPDL